MFGVWKEPKSIGSVARIETLPTHIDLKQDLWTRYSRRMIIINIEHVILRTLIFMHGYKHRFDCDCLLISDNSIKHSSLPLIRLPQKALVWMNVMDRLLEDHG